MITLDSVGSFNNSGAVSNPSNTFNNVSGDFMLVGFFYGGNVSINSMKYNGVEMTHAKTIEMTSWVYKVSLYYLPAPATGSHTVNVVLSGSSNQATVLQAISYKGVDQVSPVDSIAVGIYSHSGNTQQITLTPTTSEGWLAGWLTNSNSGTVSGGSNTTLRGIAQPQWGFVDSNGVVSSGSQTLNLTFSNNISNEGAVFLGLSFKAVASNFNQDFFRVLI